MYSFPQNYPCLTREIEREDSTRAASFLQSKCEAQFGEEVDWFAVRVIEIAIATWTPPA